ncbi:phage protein NinX family protein [Burkholderia anthina]|uniref:phage protein NinX family protein n=1 Tax=Burkholderia anthina TaxID=179879 RepID=UPI00158D52BE|nr:phage protein NinX family protein [Burkholderia anthina]
MKRTEELTDDELDHYVALALGAKEDATPEQNLEATGLMFHWRRWIGKPRNGVFVLVNRASLSTPWRPSRDWHQGGWLIERERMNFATIGTGPADESGHPPIVAIPDDGRRAMSGPTHLVAAARAVVASVYGTEVPA